MAGKTTLSNDLTDIQARLVSVELRKASFEMKKEEQQEVEANVHMLLQADIKTDSNDRFDFTVSLAAKLQGLEVENNQEIFSAECVMVGGFQVDSGKILDLPSLKAQTPRFIAIIYPLIREYVVDSLAKMGLRSFYMPWSVSPPTESAPDQQD